MIRSYDLILWDDGVVGLIPNRLLYGIWKMVRDSCLHVVVAAGHAHIVKSRTRMVDKHC